MKKVALITGITGQDGAYLAEFLLEETDWDVVGMCRWRSPLDNLVKVAPRINSGDRASLLYGDLRDTMSIHKVVADARPDEGGLRDEAGATGPSRLGVEDEGPPMGKGAVDQPEQVVGRGEVPADHHPGLLARECGDG